MQNKANSKPYSSRNKELAMIHIAKKELGFDDDLYRLILQQVTGKESAKDLNTKERKALLDDFRRRGFKGNKKNEKAKVYNKATDAQSRKLAKLWRELQDKGALENPRANLLGFLKRNKITAVDNINWMTTAEAQKAIEMLKKWLARVERNHKTEA